MKYIAVCLSRSENESSNFRVEKDGKRTFDTLEEVEQAVKEDMEEYLQAEKDAGRDVEIEGNHIEWNYGEYDEGDYEAKWYIYGVEV